MHLRRDLHTLVVSIALLSPGFDLRAGPDAETPGDSGTAALAPAPAPVPDGPSGEVRGRIERYSTDLAVLERLHRADISPGRRARLESFYKEQLQALGAVDFDALPQEERVDYLLFQNKLRFEMRELTHAARRLEEISSLIPFSKRILELEDAWRRVEPVDPAASARVLSELDQEIDRARKAIQGMRGASREPGPPPVSKAAARRAAGAVDELQDALGRWHRFYAGYHPEFTWWTQHPFQKVDKGLEEYSALIRKELAGHVPGEDEPIIGDPIGREALLDALQSEMIPYTPEELVEIARREFAWCDAEYRRAARDLGFGDDWKKALEHVKGLHVKPGEQPRLIKDLAQEAIRFLEERSLVTIPDLCKEVWRMEMMSPERQKVNPYFTGGEVISVSFPTDTMSHEDKLMSLRGNNVHFSRATVHHEVIPGHHLQGFMASRHRQHRRAFRTPFLVEGWALYWEMLLWDLGFPKLPEDRIGMLFWRSHRAARIIFSLDFHLGKMSPAEAIDYLVERVGHERRNATAEVRRSVAGDYGPLYQAAYMLGGLQLRALRKELVESGRMTDRDFHDGVLKENAIPVEMIRAGLSGQPLARDFSTSWRFYGELEPARAAREAVLTTRGEGARSRRTRASAEVFRDRVEPRWLAENTRFWYRVSLPGGGREFVLVNAVEGTRRPAFDHDRMAKALGEATKMTLDPGRLPIDSIEWIADGKLLGLRTADSQWQCDLETYQVVEVKGERREEPAAPPRGERRRRDRPSNAAPVSPDGRWEVFVRDHNLHLRSLPGREETPLTSDGSPTDSYARDVQRRRSVELEREERSEPMSMLPDASWSPDSRRLVAMRTQPGTERTVYLVESSPREQLQPKLQSYPYLKPGDEVPIQKPHLFDIEAKKEVAIDGALFPTPWSISDPRWSPDSAGFTFLYNQRGHQVLRLISVDALTGQARAMVDERSDTFIDYAGKFFLEHLEKTEEIVWMSERDGWNHLYLLDARTGAVKGQITKGEWVVRGVDHLDPEKREIWFRAGGLRPGEDPYHVHYARVGLDGTGLVLLTEGDGTHSVQFSPDRRYLVDTWSRVDLPPVTELRRADDGRVICEIERAFTSVLSEDWRPPERFVAKGRDGVTDIHGIIHWPHGFDPAKKYPVIESIYAGPQSSFVPKVFRPSYRQGELTDEGFIVVQIDGMGTSNRSKRFHDVCWKNLGDAGFPDRILWMKAAAEKHPAMDLTRVGIYGGSAGGQNAVRGLLAHGDFYRVGAADCGCHDNRMDKIWWNELWMSWPVGPHYDEQSNVTQAHRLTGKLLLTVGELDRNVDPASTMQLVNALIRADKDFDFILVPGGGHGSGEGPYGRRRRLEFFTRHLLGVEPSRAVVAEGESRSF